MSSSLLRQEPSAFQDSDPSALIATALKRTPGAGRERVIDPDNLTSPACAPEAFGGSAADGDEGSSNPVTGGKAGQTRVYRCRSTASAAPVMVLASLPKRCACAFTLSGLFCFLSMAHARVLGYKPAPRRHVILNLRSRDQYAPSPVKPFPRSQPYVEGGMFLRPERY